MIAAPNRPITWREKLTEALAKNGEGWGEVESSTLSEEQLNVQFDAGYGSVQGVPFTLWTERRVYFPVSYDGSESVRSVSRHPDGQPTDHIAG